MLPGKYPGENVLSPSVSRRHWLAGAAAFAVLPSLARAQRITAGATLQKPDPNQTTADLAAKADANDHLTVQVMINGQGPYRFVVDTGAERSVVADNVAAALNLPHGKSILVDGLSKQMLTPTVSVADLTFGPFARRGLVMPVLPRSVLYADGYLGLDAIDTTRTTFDFRHNVVRIEEPQGEAPPLDPGDEMARVRVKGRAGRLRVVDCLIDSVAATAFIDTGAEVSVGNPILHEALSSRNKVNLDLGTITLTGVTGGEIEGTLINVSRIGLQDLAFTNGTLAIADVPDFDIWDLKFRPAMLIGMDYLRQFAAVTIDYRAKELRFEVSSALPHPSPGVEIGTLA